MSSKQLDPNQLKAVYTDENIVVVAGAGSGKTTVLASRVVRLLIDKKVAIERILCLTFTRKATVEMSQRIYDLITDCIQHKQFLGTVLQPKQIEFLQEQQEHFHLAHIMTIDAFSLRIAQIGINKQGTLQPISVNSDISIHVDNFLSQWLISHQDSPLNTLLQYYTFDTLIHEVLSPILQESSCFETDMHSIHERICKKVKTILDESRPKIHNATKTLIALILSEEPEPQNSVKRFVDELNHIASCTKSSITEYDTLSRIECLLSLRGVTNTKAIKDTIANELKEGQKDIQALIACYNRAISTWHNKSDYHTYYVALQPLLDDWNIYRNKFGIYSYSNISEIAQHTLVHYQDIREWYSTLYQHVIIDEFQDNNLQQKKLLYALSHTPNTDSLEQSKYFFVGDPKQSIYGFRGADIQAFLSLKKDIEPLHMHTNYRSNISLIHTFNKWFKTLFDDDSFKVDGLEYIEQIPISQTHAEHDSFSLPSSNNSPLSRLLAQEEQLLLETQLQDTTHIHCIFDLIENNLDYLSSKERKDLEAYHIVIRIASMIQKGIAPSDIAVLARTKTILPLIATYLLDQGIQFNMEDATSSLPQDIGIDFYSWISLLLYPDDKSMYAAILRSPLAHLSDNTVIALLALQHTIDTTTLFMVPDIDTIIKNIDEYMMSDVNTTSSTPIRKIIVQSKKDIRDSIIQNQEDVNALYSIRKKYEEAKQILNEGDMSHLLYHFWIECGYRYILLKNPKYHIFLEQYHVLKSMIDIYQSQSIVDFARKLGNYIHGVPITQDHPTENSQGVHLMSIHKSKGLEFPYVILADMNASFSNRGHKRVSHTVKDELLYIDFPDRHCLPYLLKSSHTDTVHDTIYKHYIDTKPTLDDELLRIFYVAATRAQCALVISGYYPKQSKSGTVNSYLKLMQARQLLPDIAFDLVAYSKEGIHVTYDEVSILCLHQGTSIMQQRDDMETMSSHNNNVKELLQHELNAASILQHITKDIEIAPSITKKNIDEETFQLPEYPVDSILDKYNMYTAFGSYCHFLLNHYCQGNMMPALAMKLESQLLSLSEKEFMVFTHSAEQIAKKFLHHKIWAHNSHATIHTEYPFLMWNDTHQVRIRGIIDLLIITDNKYIIIDYKSDRYKKLTQHVYQLATYHLAIKKIFQVKDDSQIQSYLFYLRNGEIYQNKEFYTEDELMQVYVSNEDSQNIDISNTE